MFHGGVKRHFGGLALIAQAWRCHCRQAGRQTQTDSITRTKKSHPISRSKSTVQAHRFTQLYKQYYAQAMFTHIAIE